MISESTKTSFFCFSFGTSNPTQNLLFTDFIKNWEGQGHIILHYTPPTRHITYTITSPPFSSSEFSPAISYHIHYLTEIKSW